MSGPPIRKWPGVRACVSLGSEGIWHNGRELRHASIWIKIVDISSKLIHALPMTQCMWCFMDFIPASQRPPKCGESGGMKCQQTCVLYQIPLTLWSRITSKDAANSVLNFGGIMFTPIRNTAVASYAAGPLKIRLSFRRQNVPLHILSPSTNTNIYIVRARDNFCS